MRCEIIQSTWDAETENMRRCPCYQNSVEIRVVHVELGPAEYWDDEDLRYCDT